MAQRGISFTCSVYEHEREAFVERPKNRKFEPLSTGVLFRDFFKQRLDSLIIRKSRILIFAKRTNEFYIMGDFRATNLDKDLLEIAQAGEDFCSFFNRQIILQLQEERKSPENGGARINGAFVSWNPDHTGSVRTAGKRFESPVAFIWGESRP